MCRSELQGLADLLLKSSDYSAGRADADGAPLPNDEQTAQRIVEERSRLLNRFLATRWEIDSSGAITLYITGQIAVFDDIEAVFARSPIQAGSRYEVAGLESQATPEELRDAGSAYPSFVQDRYLTLPDTVTARTLALAASIAARESNNFDVARAIERDVRTTIEYSLDIDSPPSGQDVVDYVLFDSQIGYCEYHASAMAVLLRAAGIPSRVAVGYHQVAFDPATKAFTYRESDAHAWVEAFFPGYGWIPFEPTPSEPLRDYGPGDGDESDALSLPTATPTPLPEVTSIPTDEAAQESSPTPTPPPPAINEATRTDAGGRWLAGLGSLGCCHGALGALWCSLVRLDQAIPGLEPRGNPSFSDHAIREVDGCRSRSHYDSRRVRGRIGEGASRREGACTARRSAVYG